MPKNATKRKRTRKPGPRFKRSDTQFHGVYYRRDGNPKYPYVAWFCQDGKTIRLGEYTCDVHAALAADFARYAVWGTDYQFWPISEKRHRRPNPPNFSPSCKLLFNRQEILRKLFRCGCLSAVDMATNLSAYDETAAKLSIQSV